MKLAKLIYIAHGWYLGLTGEPLITEGVQAWKYGPVIKSIYYDFKQYGNNRIDALQMDEDRCSYPIVTDKNIIELLDKVWEIYSKFTAVQLSTMTHIEGTPWFITWELRGGKNTPDTIIPNELIESHYKGKVNAPTRE